MTQKKLNEKDLEAVVGGTTEAAPEPKFKKGDKVKVPCKDLSGALVEGVVEDSKFEDGELCYLIFTNVDLGDGTWSFGLTYYSEKDVQPC